MCPPLPPPPTCPPFPPTTNGLHYPTTSPTVSPATSPTQASDVLGDVNRDGYFDTFDVQALKNWVAGSSGYTDPTSLTTFQRQQFDPTLDFLTAPDDTSKCPQGWTYGTPCPHTQDIVYSNYVYANFYRWMKLSSQAEVDAAVVENTEPTGVLSFSVPIYGKDNAVVSDTTVVQFEIGVTGDNLQMQWSVGTYVSSSDDGVLVTASGPSSGVYSASATGPTSNGNSFVAESAVGFVAIVKTYDSEGASANERVWAFQGSTQQYQSSYKAFTTFELLGTTSAPTASITSSPITSSPITSAPSSTPTAAPSATPTTSSPTSGAPSFTPTTAHPTTASPTGAPTTVSPSTSPTTLSPPLMRSTSPTTFSPTTFSPQHCH
ncbi:hypothetical protein CYMTET_6001 [Cymbomonas tetramitiformis]|uniref:Dockerin domain-containing protein n=1 Tax=Cymbomonas tetramitiformis TaxID=36881 RepID=A0AAE0LIV2_9CHLO|nr:hypothetical protein CYMTET_6001 [Cymbomonas tetramitiformis]